MPVGIDLTVGLLTLATQVFVTGRLLKRFGTGVAASALPAVYIEGFAALALDELRYRQSGAPRVLYDSCARREERRAASSLQRLRGD